MTDPKKRLCGERRQELPSISTTRREELQEQVHDGKKRASRVSMNGPKFSATRSHTDHSSMPKGFVMERDGQELEKINQVPELEEGVLLDQITMRGILLGEILNESTNRSMSNQR